MPLSVNDVVPAPRKARDLDGSFIADSCPWRIGPLTLDQVAVSWKLHEELSVEPHADASLHANELIAGELRGTCPDPPDRPQGYALRVEPDGLMLRGADTDGFYWGLVTLEQLLDGGRELPACEIIDWPSIGLRGHHDDISRKQISKRGDFLRIIRRLSRYKINLYTPYMEDVLYLRSYPDIGQGRGRLTPEEVAAMHQEAERHNVTIMPTYSLMGHQENLLSHAKYAHLGRKVFQPMSSLDPSSPAVREFLHRVIGDVCGLFPCEYFHAGFDEAIGVEGQEFIDHANWCARELAAHGKRMLMWVDMFYNHFGIERLGELEDSIIPVNWGYGTRPGEHVVDGHYVHHDELCAQGRPVWGLAGYNSVCRFLPDAAAGRENIDVWARTARETDTPALVAAQWGDNGYENHRDLPWNLFAYLGEAAWSGEDARPEDFERRFQRHFYGVELPPLQEVLYDLPQQLSAGLSEYWRRFRRGAPWSIRWAEQNPDAAQGLSSDEERLSAALLRVEDCRAVAQRNAEHLDHFTVALERMLSVVRRQKVGVAYVGGLNLAETVQSVQQVKRHLSDVREHYIADWIRTNKPPNMEVSLQVYDRVLDSYDFLLEYEPSEQVSRGGFLPLLLEGLFNRNEPAVADAPLGLRRCNGVPFNFADRHHTHVALVQGDASLSVEFEECAVEDLHLLVAGERRTDEPAPALRVELLRGGEVVFREDLMTIVHLCDWWAPRGEHIWAGGGMAHVNRDRVRYALDVGNMHGVAEVYNFALDGGAEADALRLTALGESEVALFAATLEGCPGRGGAAWSE